MRSFSVRSSAEYAVLPEKKLWDCLRREDKEAFDFIYHKYVNILYNYGIRITADSVIVEDCIQELFVEIWEKKNRLSPTDSIKYYLFKSLRRRINRQLLRENHRAAKLWQRREEYFELVVSYEQILIDRQLAGEQRKMLTAALQMLPARQREAVFLRYFEELSYEQVAAVMSIKVNAAYKLVCKALAFLRKDMQKPAQSPVRKQPVSRKHPGIPAWLVFLMSFFT